MNPQARALLLLAALGCRGRGEAPGPAGGAAEPGSDGAPAAEGWPAGALILDGVTVRDAFTRRPEAAVVLAGDSVWAVTDARQAWPADAAVLDFAGYTVIPGLIDAHVHLFHAGTTAWVGDTLAANLAANLAWGVVGAADLGSPAEIFDLRDRIAAGEIRGPRLWATGPMLTAPGSHPCEVTYDRSLCRLVEGDGEAAVAELARADGIKVALADADFTPWPTPRLDLADLAAITAAAAVPVWAHTDEAADAADALAAGAAVLAHPVFAADLAQPPAAPTLSTVGAFAGTGALLSGELLAEDLSSTPQAVLSSWQAIAADPGALAPGWAEASAAWEAHARANLALAIAAGETVIAGSDAGYWFVPHGLGLHRELAALVEAGMSPAQALAAATWDSAQLLGWADLGRVAAGYRADLVVLAGDPGEDIAYTRQIAAVILGGEVYEGGDPLLQPREGGFCLDDRDCTGRCDLVSHQCAPACAPPYDVAGDCGAARFCNPADGLATTAEGVCHPAVLCDLYAQDCAPALYGEACVPVDLDTSACWPAGPRAPGQGCSWSDPALFCEQGSFCSWVDGLCYRLCDPDAAPSAGCACERQHAEGQPWFGICR